MPLLTEWFAQLRSTLFPATTSNVSLTAAAAFRRLTFVCAMQQLMPVVRAEEEEEELVDPQQTLREQCVEHHCDRYKVRLDTCNDRVNSRSKTTETCECRPVGRPHPPTCPL